MNGKLMIGGIVGAALAMGVGLWYSQTYAYYERVDGLTEITAFGDSFPVSNYRSIDAVTSPLKLRACFSVDWDYAENETFKTIAEPLVAPGWFDCFDAEAIDKDIKAGAASALLVEKNNPFGFSRFVAQYPDGRAYMWRQMNECGKAQFEGTDMPAGCEDEEVSSQGAVALPEPAPQLAAVKRVGVASGGVRPMEVSISLTPVNGSAPEEILYEGVTATSDNALPHSMWACFRTPMSMGMLTESYKVNDQVTPENPARQLSCFNAEQVKADVNEGQAVAFLGQKDVWPGFDRVVAVYQDGRAVAWHQKRAD